MFRLLKIAGGTYFASPYYYLLYVTLQLPVLRYLFLVILLLPALRYMICVTLLLKDCLSCLIAIVSIYFTLTIYNQILLSICKYLRRCYVRCCLTTPASSQWWHASPCYFHPAWDWHYQRIRAVPFTKKLTV